MPSKRDEIAAGFAKAVKDLRADGSLTQDALADAAGIHRTMIGQIESHKTQPTIETAQAIAEAFDLPLSDLIRRAELEAGFAPKNLTAFQQRAVDPAHCLNEDALLKFTGLPCDALTKAIGYMYETLDTIDNELTAHGAPVIANLVELANLSSMIGNLLGAGLAQASGGLYERNKPHTYPDLLPQKPPAVDLELKMALETNKPKGHLPKAGTYITFRYVLADENGNFMRGKKNRGTKAYVWEVKVGALTEADFDISNTEGDSGKTAVIKTTVFHDMPTVYEVPQLYPYARRRGTGARLPLP